MNSMSEPYTNTLIETFLETFIKQEGKNQSLTVDDQSTNRAAEYDWLNNSIRFNYHLLLEKFHSLKKQSAFQTMTYEHFIKWIVLHEYCHSIDSGLVSRMTLAKDEHEKDNFRNVYALILISELICYQLMRKHIKNHEKEMFRAFKHIHLREYKRDVVIQRNFYHNEHVSLMKKKISTY